jgi:hypothetical protein
MDALVIAVGCAGGRMVNRIIERGRIDAEYLAINTDRWELDACRVSRKILVMWCGVAASSSRVQRSRVFVRFQPCVTVLMTSWLSEYRVTTDGCRTARSPTIAAMISMRFEVVSASPPRNS